MRKRTFVVIIISIFIFVVVAFASQKIMKNKVDNIDKKEWVQRTLNKEHMRVDGDCGVASVKMMLGFYGYDISYDFLRKQLNTTIDGTEWENIQSYFQSFNNLKPLEYENNIEKAKDYLNEGYPLLICWNVDEEEDYSHYSVLIAIDKNSVWMLDPIEKKSLSQYSLEYFLPCWQVEDYWFCALVEKDKINGNDMGMDLK